MYIGIGDHLSLWSSLKDYCFSLFDVFTGLSNAAKLLGCSVPQLVIALSTRKIQAGKENIVQRLTLTQVGYYLKIYLPGTMGQLLLIVFPSWVFL